VFQAFIPMLILLSEQTTSATGQRASAGLDPGVIIAGLYVFALAAFLGYQVISRVPPLLHTPLMSATNAISAISIVGALVTAGGSNPTVSKVLGLIAVTSAMINVVGGFMITDRMLRMFRRKIPAAQENAKKEQNSDE
jgi:H+-translocating NAD(P) transhydrogenase subunit alpha